MALRVSAAAAHRAAGRGGVMAAEFGLAAVGAAALTEGIKFLYGQAAELLKRRRERRSKGETAQAPGSPPAPAEAPQPPEGVFEGVPRLDEVDETVLDKVEEGLGELLERPALVRVSALGREADASDAELLEAAEALRSLLEHVHRQRITFRGEPGRPASGPLVFGEAEAETVDGLLAGVRARRIAGGTVHGKATGGHVAGEAIGVEADVIE